MVIGKAFSHIMRELQLDNIRKSLRYAYDKVQKGHDSIHEFVLIAPYMFPRRGPSWHTRSAFLLYHWETLDLAHRSLYEALCAYYNSAFVLLRSVTELLVKGAFFECMAHANFRENSDLIEKDRSLKQLKSFLNAVIKEAPSIAIELDEISAAIYDKLSPILNHPSFHPSVHTIIKQLARWKIFDPINHGKELVYGLYREICPDVHVIPDKTDVGRLLLLKPEELFEAKKVFPSILEGYVDLLKKIMDVGIIIELNILKDNIQYDEARTNLENRLPVLQELELEHSYQRVTSLVT